MRLLLPLLAVMACNTDPSSQLDQFVDYRDGLEGGATSGERGSIKITEVLWSGTVREDGSWDPSDVFFEVRNESARPANLTGWRLTVSGVVEQEFRLPVMPDIDVGDFAIVAAKNTGCFPDAEAVLPGLAISQNDPFRMTLRDADERLMELAGDRDARPFAGGYDFRTSRSMERVNLMFGGRGTEPTAWHFATREDCPAALIVDPETDAGLSCYEGIPNNDKMLAGCRAHTHATPGRPNSPDYTGAYASGGFE